MAFTIMPTREPVASAARSTHSPKIFRLLRVWRLPNLGFVSRKDYA